MILITTSRRPTQQIRTLCNDLSHVFPHSLRINRGKLNFSGIIDKALLLKMDRLILIEKWKDGFGTLNLYILSPTVSRFYPIVYLSSVISQKELGLRQTISPNLGITLQQDTAPVLTRLAVAFANFSRLPLEHCQIDRPFQASLHFSGMKKNRIKIALTKPPKLKEMGPILIVKHLMWDACEKNK